ncbi:IS66 family transposase, partial [Stutzerimonas stutzeri]
MIAVPESPPDDPILLKQLLLLANEQAAAKDARIAQLQEQVALLRRKLFSPKSERSPGDDDSPQLAMFNEAEELVEAAPEAAAEETEEETVAPAKRRGRRKSLPANLPRVEIIHELPEHELTCECGCRKRVIGEETSEQLEIIPMQVRVIRHIRKTYACKACEAAPITADKPAQLIEKSLASPSVLAMLLTAKYADGIPLYRFEKMLSRHGVDVPRQTLARWVIQCAEHLQPLLNLMRDTLLDYPVLHCDETRLQVLHEPGRDPTAQSWMWVQSGGPPGKPVTLFDYSTSRAQDVPLRLLDGYRGYLMTDDYAGYNAVALQDGIERMGCWAHARRKFVEAQKVQPKGKTGRADMALNLIGKLYGIERELKASSDAE